MRAAGSFITRSLNMPSVLRLESEISLTQEELLITHSGRLTCWSLPWIERSWKRLRPEVMWREWIRIDPPIGLKIRRLRTLASHPVLPMKSSGRVEARPGQREHRRPDPRPGHHPQGPDRRRPVVRGG